MAELLPPSIQLTEAEWRTTLTTVQAEGKDDYAEWAPSFLAAIELGFMDEHLQLFARHMRQRYIHLMDPSKPGPSYVPTDIEVPVFDSAAQVYGRDTRLAPVRRGVLDSEPIKATEFRALGNAYPKKDFVGCYVAIDFPARGVGRGNIWQVVKTLRGSAFVAQLVKLGNPARASDTNRLGMEQRFKYEFHTHLFVS